MYAVIESGSKQYRVEVGTELEVELIDAEPGQTITLDRVLLVADGETAAIGRPIVDGATVSAEVLGRERGEKLIVFKYRPKARRRVKKGHRQNRTVLRVADIVFGGKSAAESVRKAATAAKTERQRLEEAAARQAAEDAALAAKLAKAAEPASDGGTAKKGKARADTSAKTSSDDGPKTRGNVRAKAKAPAATSVRRGSRKSDSEAKAESARGTRAPTPGKARSKSGDATEHETPKRGSRTKKDD